jgi:hypothetical protein
MTQQTTHAGIEAAWLHWLEQHDVSVPLILQNAVEAAVKRWLDQHHDELVAAIAHRLNAE